MRILMLRRLAAALTALAIVAPTLAAQTVPAPREHFGFEIGADRKLANWDELTAYFERLAQTSPRVTIDTLGFATAGSPFVMLTITSPENHARLEELRRIQDRLADPRLVESEEELARLFDEGRTIVLITQGIHANEVGASQMSANLAYQLATSNDGKILEILDNVIVLQIPSLNPDGLQWIANWYNEHVGTDFEASPLPWLYHYYNGHDNNRDWYAFTQKETILTVLGAHNVWHPQIVHDVHQMGATEARIFFPPYVEPWEPNIDPAITTAVNQLGTYMAAELGAQGKKGVVINGVYDAYTPSRAYSHYKGGARVLSETASVDIATPVNISARRLGPRIGYDSSRRSWNYPDPWPGGQWTLSDIVAYQQAGALALLTNAAKNRRFWLENFYEINKRAVEKWETWPDAWIIPADGGSEQGIRYALRALTMAEVEVHRAERPFTADGLDFPAGSWVIPMSQPYAGFANTMLEVQHYPDLRQYPGGPPVQPYDVTAHTLGYLLDFEAVAVDGPIDARLSEPIEPPDFAFELPAHLSGPDAPRVAMYKSWEEPMTEGWQRWVFDQHGMQYDTLHDADIRSGALADYDVLILQSQSPESILNGYSADDVPAPYAGGLAGQGSDEVRAFVRNGGRVVAIEGAAQYIADLFGLDVRDATSQLPDTQFFIPGSLLRLELDTTSELVEGMRSEVAAWFWDDSRAFLVNDPRVRVAARYGSGDPLLSGWAIGTDRLEGQPALLEADLGPGSVVLFGFQPNYRAQSLATWPLLFNAIRK
jgi:hypothetical protein